MNQVDALLLSAGAHTDTAKNAPEWADSLDVECRGTSRLRFE